MMVLSLFRSYISYHTALLETGSMPVVGSSKKMTFGFPIAEIATESLLFMPPE